ncbi:MAG TPA: serine/threonine-protein kinase [Polyangiales bacterium]|nr:serine/threonine-protein kinase [Polyangiales bacterium]
MQKPHSGSVPAGAELGVFGKYHLIASLGQGGMANVFLALMPGPSGFNKLLVIKIMRQDMLAGSEEGVRMFMAEARLAARLVHPNIVHTYEVGELDGRYFLAMEYLDGQPLSTVLNRARGDQEIPLAEYLRMIAELARGLHYAHTLKGFQGEQLEVVHRDVSPQNVIVTYDGHVKLLDFGIAKTADAEHLTQVGMIKGKLDYIAPEQLRSDRIDGRADIFALGAMMWEVISGHRFAGGRKVSDVNKMQARLTGGERKLRALRPDVPPSLEAIVERAVALEPAARFETATELADAIEAHLEEMKLRSSTRALSEHMERLFASERAELHKLIDEQVQRVKRGSLPPEVDASSGPRRKLALYLSDGPMDERSSIRHMPARSTTPAPPASFTWVALLLLALAGGAGAMWFVIGNKPPAPLPAVAIPVPAKPAELERPPSAPLPKNTIALSVIVDPPQARVSLDGVPLSLPFQGAFTKDDANHRLEASAEGFRPLKQFVAFDQDRELTLRLDRSPGQRKSPFERLIERAGQTAPDAPLVPPRPKPAPQERPNPYED